jgi:uncharacterized lipoprotein YddW (UPF0748 family)
MAWGQKRPTPQDDWQTAEEIIETREPARTPVRPQTPTPRRVETKELAPARPQAVVHSGAEMRALWVVRDTLTSPTAIRQMVETAASNGFNTIFVQVRGRADAYFNSPYEPRAEALSNQPDSFDPLAVVIQEAHAKGIEVHAWLNTYLAWSGNRRPQSPEHLWNAHQDWFATDREGRCSPLAVEDAEGAFLQPSNPEVQEHLFKVFTHVAQNYDVDGIHFDYIRYANSRYDFSNAALKRFRNTLRDTLSRSEVAEVDQRVAGDRTAWAKAFPQQWEAWRRAQVTGLVSRVSETIHQRKPRLQITAAVYADGKEAAKFRGQEWMAWLEQGVVNGVVLMAYSQQTEKVVQQAQAAVEAANGGKVYMGLGAWRLRVQDIAEKIHAVRLVGANGFCLFSYDRLKQSPEYLPSLSKAVMSGGVIEMNRTASRTQRDNEDNGERPTRRK